MPLFTIPVMLPFQVEGADAQVIPVQVTAAASSTPAALATAQVLVAAYTRARLPGVKVRLMVDKARIGQPGPQVSGLYAYTFGRGPQIHQLTFPGRLDLDEGHHLGESLKGLDAKSLIGVVFDCHALTYLNSTALAAFAGHAERLNLHLFRVSEPVKKVFELVGITNLVPIHPDLQSALVDLVNRSRATGQFQKVTGG